MAIAYVQSVAPWGGASPQTSASATTTAGNALVVWGQETSTGGITVSASGSVDGAIASQVQGNTLNFNVAAVLAKASITGGAQTITISSSTAGNSISGIGHEYSGVGSIGSAALSTSNAPGTGAGALLGTAVTVPTGAVLLAFAFDDSGGVTTITPTVGTQRETNTFTQGNTYTLAEISGTGASVTPAFTVGNGTALYAVLQVLLLPPVASNAPFLPATDMPGRVPPGVSNLTIMQAGTFSIPGPVLMGAMMM